jgi:hypothetical protein
MEDKKYYIPSTEEFYVGFECEYLVGLGKNFGKWKQYIINSSSKLYNTFGLRASGSIRVKYLDREDIESFGFVYSPINLDGSKAKNKPSITLEDNSGSFNRYTYKDFVLQYYIRDSSIVISCPFYIMVHRIIIKNKSVFKKLLKQLNIE